MKPKPALQQRVRRLQRGLAKLYPDAKCALDHQNPLQLLIATILSAQCTDVRVNLVTPALFARPSHPYTQGLFASVPRLRGPVERLRPIRGNVPPPSAWPSGCRFRPRCPQAFDKSETMPPLLPLDPEHRMRCWLAETERS